MLPNYRQGPQPGCPVVGLCQTFGLESKRFLRKASVDETLLANTYFSYVKRNFWARKSANAILSRASPSSTAVSRLLTIFSLLAHSALRSAD